MQPLTLSNPQRFARLGLLDEDIKPDPRLRELSDEIRPRPHAGKKSRRTHARVWVKPEDQA